ncbi:hypothetical protein BXZ70DRAFT_944170 [Cristinia sonorae]|uniref:Uncharacterized protein n=1 Tax=Cristinia sonorae TaxID=1940300 RepID=A0A8K0XNI2_9AGAR|nr:hypothetical protein BXZ70DRAFT_944170 [Cristinia sonorae]
MLRFIGGHCSARECILSFEEVQAHLAVALLKEDSDVEDTPSDSEGKQDDSAVLQLVRILDAFGIVLPRLPKRKKTPSEILRPLVDHLAATIRLVAQIANIQEGKDIIASASRFTASLSSWADGNEDEQTQCNLLLFEFICSTLEMCSRSTNIGLAQLAFEAQFPRFASRSGPSSSSSVDEDIVQDAVSALAHLGLTLEDYLKRPSIGSLILVAHLGRHSLGSDLFALLRWILTSLQTNTALDEILAILLTSLGQLRATGDTSVPSQFVIPLVQVLGPVAGCHPDAPTRHLVFRLLSITLTLSAPAIRLQLLRDLLSDSEALTPQMQVAAIGLVREATIEALSVPEQSPPNPFASPILLREIGPMVFSLQSSELFSSCEVALDDFMQSPEPLRLVESLTLLFVLLKRDLENRTGIRDNQQINDIGLNFLAPLQAQMDFWKQGQDSNDNDSEHSHNLMQLGILDMWLERTQSAVQDISEGFGDI